MRVFWETGHRWWAISDIVDRLADGNLANLQQKQFISLQFSRNDLAARVRAR